MSSYIGTFEFIRMEGAKLPTKALTIETFDRAATDGSGFRQFALKAGQQVVVTEESIYAQATANSRPDDYRTLQGQMITVEDDMGRVVNDVLVVEAVVISTRKIPMSSVSGDNYRVRAEWVLKPMG